MPTFLRNWAFLVAVGERNHLWDLCDCAACSEIGFEPLVGGTPSQNPEKFERG